MMKKFSVIVVLIGVLFLQSSCNKSGTEVQIVIPKVTEDIEIQDFIWQGLNGFYLWQESVPNLNDTKIDDKTDYVNFLKATPDPKDFFEKLIYNRTSVDFWSWIVDDYIELENSFAGISKSNGVDFRLSRFSDSNDVFGYVRLILPDSDASNKNIKRGDLFTSVNGTKLNLDNYRDLLFNDNVDTYTLNLSKIENGIISSTSIDVELTKSEYTENPVFITKTFDEGGRKIGYIMYNSFTANFDNELNDAFLQLKNDGITDLILDFRYNPGGRVSTATSMASMITGQFKGELFTKERWNSKIQAEIENSNPEFLINNFSDKMTNGNSINSLNLTSVHIIITGSSASASELIINGLNPYINVRLVGEQSVGKYVASVTLYDSANFRREGVNPNHRYAMQPIVLEEVNKLGENDTDGFDPDIAIPEELENLGVLGDSNEPLLRAAINDIIGAPAKSTLSKSYSFETVTDSRMHTLLKDNMFVDKKDLNKYFKRTNINLK